jgi:hypothetical protein
MQAVIVGTAIILAGFAIKDGLKAIAEAITKSTRVA